MTSLATGVALAVACSAGGDVENPQVCAVGAPRILAGFGSLVPSLRDNQWASTRAGSPNELQQVQASAVAIVLDPAPVSCE